MSNKEKCPWNLGATLYSFNKEYFSYEKTFEDIMADMGSLGKGTGVELVFQQFERHYPDLSPEFEARFKRAMEKYELVPTMFSGYDDPQYLLSDDDTIDFISRQIQAANRLGFHKARLYPLYREHLLDRLLPIAEKYDVALCAEVHCPHTMEGELVEELVSIFDKWDTPYLGLFPDCGTMCREPSVVYTDRFRKQGVKEETIQLIVDLWKQGKTEAEISEAVAKIDNSQLAQLMVVESSGYFGHGDPAAIAPLMKYIKHVHMKFFHVDENLNENAVRVPEIVKVLKDNGYNDSISAEYEGHHWFADSPAVEQINRIHQLVRKSYEEA